MPLYCTLQLWTLLTSGECLEGHNGVPSTGGFAPGSSDRREVSYQAIIFQQFPLRDKHQAGDQDDFKIFSEHLAVLG